MKTKLFTLIALAAIVFSTQNANATIRRVGYFGTAISGVDYTDLQSAHDAALKGDTILVFPGNWNATYTKKLVTIGYGYYLTGAGSNAGLQNITGTLSITVYLDAHSDSCVFTGLDGFTLDENTGVSISNISVSRCNGNVFFEDKTYNNWQIKQCYINTYLASEYSTSKPTNLLVSNCYITLLSMSTLNSQTGQFVNNIFSSTYNQGFGNGAFLLSNNIFLGGHSGEANCTYQNNIASSSSPLPAGNGNQNLTAAQMNALFVGYPTQSTYTNDGRYVLKTGSLAIGTGTGGTDCGIYGNTNPYRLSGIPAIPAFYKLTAPNTITSGNPYTITFSVRSNN
jgi:hypothetical protein